MPKPWKAAALEMRARLADQRVTIAFTAPRPGGLHQQAYTLQAGITRHIMLPEAIAGSAVGELPLNITLLRFETRIPGPRADESAGAVLARLGIDGVKWAAEMALHFPIDPAPGGHFHTWIANAIEAGITEGESRERKRRATGEQPHLKRALEDLGAEYGTLSVLRVLRGMWPESWRAVKAVNIPLAEVEPSRPLSADVPAVAYAHSGVPTPMPADEAQARHAGFTEAIRESGQRIADAAVAVNVTGVPAMVDPVAAGIIGTMAYTSRQQQAEIGRLRREKAQMREANARLITERDGARTQLAQLSDRHQAMAFELAEHKQKLSDLLRAWDDLQATSGRYKAERDDAQNAVATVNAYANRYQEQRDEARRERDSAQANVTTLLEENARLNEGIAERDLAGNNATRAYNEQLAINAQLSRDLAVALATPRES